MTCSSWSTVHQRKHCHNVIAFSFFPFIIISTIWSDDKNEIKMPCKKLVSL